MIKPKQFEMGKQIRCPVMIFQNNALHNYNFNHQDLSYLLMQYKIQTVHIELQ